MKERLKLFLIRYKSPYRYVFWYCEFTKPKNWCEMFVLKLSVYLKQFHCYVKLNVLAKCLYIIDRKAKDAVLTK